jgi:hypothetical protein
MSVTLDELYRLSLDTRDSLTRQNGETKSAINTLANEVLDLSKRVRVLEEKDADRDSIPPVAVVPPELTDLLSEVREERARTKARSQLHLEAEAAKAKALLEAEAAREKFEQRVMFWVKVGAGASPLLAALGGALAWVVTHWH